MVICYANNQFQACIRLYFLLGYYETAVNLALSRGEVEVAKDAVKKAKGLSRSSKKRLWMLIANYILKGDDGKNSQPRVPLVTLIQQKTKAALLLIQIPIFCNR